LKELTFISFFNRNLGRRDDAYSEVENTSKLKEYV